MLGCTSLLASKSVSEASKNCPGKTGSKANVPWVVRSLASECIEVHITPLKVGNISFVIVSCKSHGGFEGFVYSFANTISSWVMA